MIDLATLVHHEGTGEGGTRPTAGSQLDWAVRTGGANRGAGARTFPGTWYGLIPCQSQDSVVKPINIDLVMLGKCPKIITQDIFEKPNSSSAPIRHYSAALHLDKSGAMVEHDGKVALDTLDIECKLKELAKLDRIFINVWD